MGRTAGRTSIGRTAFGELLVFRDLREHAASLGMEDAELACDVAAIDIHFKRMKVLSMSAEEFVELLDDAEWQNAFLRKPLYEAAKARLGEWGPTECYGFVPALSTSYFPPPSRRNNPSPIWLRAELPVHNTKIRFIFIPCRFERCFRV